MELSYSFQCKKQFNVHAQLHILHKPLGTPSYCKRMLNQFLKSHIRRNRNNYTLPPLFSLCAKGFYSQVTSNLWMNKQATNFLCLIINVLLINQYFHLQALNQDALNFLVILSLLDFLKGYITNEKKLVLTCNVGLELSICNMMSGRSWISNSHPKQHNNTNFYQTLYYRYPTPNPHYMLIPMFCILSSIPRWYF